MNFSIKYFTIKGDDYEPPAKLAKINFNSNILSVDEYDPRRNQSRPM